jgi:hypothetical protein
VHEEVTVINTKWMTQPVALAVNALAAYRLTRLWTRDYLPPQAHVPKQVQEKQDEVQDAKGTTADHPLSELVHCPWCVGFWISVGVVGAATLAPRAWRPLATALAFSAVVANIAVREPSDDD